MASTNIAGTRGVASASKKSKTIVGRDRLVWRVKGDRYALHHGNNPQPLARVEGHCGGLGGWRVHRPDGSISEALNLTRAKDAAIALALRSLNSGAQETEPVRAYVRKKHLKVV
jgi:hypothetical protein